MSSVEQWLVRTQQNWIKGPYSRETLCEMIREGGVELQDEVCVGNGYWIYLHESEEIEKQLGICRPKAAERLGKDEKTETNTEIPSGGVSNGHANSNLEAFEKIDFQPQVEVVGNTDRSPIRGAFGWILLILSGFLFALVVRKLKS